LEVFDNRAAGTSEFQWRSGEAGRCTIQMYAIFFC
jgi:hypothetical protein